MSMRQFHCHDGIRLRRKTDSCGAKDCFLQSTISIMVEVEIFCLRQSILSLSEETVLMVIEFLSNSVITLELLYQKDYEIMPLIRSVEKFERKVLNPV